jgi:two-component system, NarL family, response regulator NreC
VIASPGTGVATELAAADGAVQIVGHARTLADAEAALRALRPSVLVLDADLAHREGVCAIPALRRASPGTAIVLPPAGEPGPRVLHAVRLASRTFERRRDGDGLTLRERDVVRLIALGHTNAEVAERLSVSVRTIETHRGRIQRRLRLSGRAQLVRWALEHGLLDP